MLCELPFGLKIDTTSNQTLGFGDNSNLENIDANISKKDKKT